MVNLTANLASELSRSGEEHFEVLLIFEQRTSRRMASLDPMATIYGNSVEVCWAMFHIRYQGTRLLQSRCNFWPDVRRVLIDRYSSPTAHG